MINVIAIIVSILIIAEAIATTLIVPEFKHTISELGTTVPIFTKFVLYSPYWIWLLPMVSVASVGYKFKSQKSKAAIITIILLLGLAWIPAGTYGVYLPIFELE